MLIDELLRYDWPMHGRDMREFLYQALRFEVTNVADYAFAYFLDKKFSFREEMPNVAPLAPITWLEWRPRAKAGQESDRLGNLIIAVEMGTGWRCTVFIFMGTSGSYNLLDWVFSYTVSARGEYGDWFVPIGVDEEEARYLWGQCCPSLFATCFAHCRNVVQREVQPSRQVRRQAERRQEPVFTYRMLDIEPMKPVLEREGGITQNGIARALHICRGHFAHYTQDKPLFGKYTGTVYVPMHTRGSLKQGAVVKDYRVLSPNSEAPLGRLLAGER